MEFESYMGWIHNNSEVIIAISAVFISVVSLFVSIRSLSSQKNHNKLSVKPIAHFSKGDYENKIFVKIKNYGLGPLIVEEFDIQRGQKKFKRLIDSLEGLSSNITWDTFTDNIDGRTLAPQKEFVLLQVSFNEGQNKIRNEIRKLLSETTLTVKYKCIYGEDHPYVQEKLDWFSRNLKKLS